MTVEQSLRAYLDEQTATGLLRPGSRLPTERELVAMLPAPRSAVRRALGQLEANGIVMRHVGRGTFLSDVTHLGADGAPPDTSPSEIMQVRLVLEPPVAALAARLATKTDLDRISDCLAAGDAAESFETFEAADAKLHRAIAAAAHNGLLINLFDVMNTARALPVWGTLKRRTSTPQRRRCYHDEHAAIVAALADRDPGQSEQTMRLHLEHVADNLLGRH